MNGVDVSQCSHEEAVQRFLEASEPIMVEVKRRQAGKVSQTTEAKVMTMMMMLTMMLLMLIMVEVKRRQGKVSKTTQAKVGFV